jgi:hypothetical protein
VCLIIIGAGLRFAADGLLCGGDVAKHLTCKGTVVGQDTIFLSIELNC